MPSIYGKIVNQNRLSGWDGRSQGLYGFENQIQGHQKRLEWVLFLPFKIGERQKVAVFFLEKQTTCGLFLSESNLCGLVGLDAKQHQKNGKNHGKSLIYIGNVWPLFAFSHAISKRIELESWGWSQINVFFVWFTYMIQSNIFGWIVIAFFDYLC